MEFINKNLTIWELHYKTDIIWFKSYRRDKRRFRIPSLVLYSKAIYQMAVATARSCSKFSKISIEKLSYFVKKICALEKKISVSEMQTRQKVKVLTNF